MRFARYLAFMLLALASAAVIAAPRAQQAFPTPSAAAQALLDAVRANDRAAMAAVLGPGSNELIDSGDPVEDSVARLRFVAAAEQSIDVRSTDGRHATVVIGPERWVVPFPLVRNIGGWHFDARAGKKEVIARRIGRNELAAMQAALAFVDAQQEYARAVHDGVGPGVYARWINSTPGRHDGLYWTPSREEPLSPLGVMFTLAAADETANGEARPYHGYYFRVLTSQGAYANGGAADYFVNGRLMGGVALIAWPVKYRVSGVRTFIVSHEGIVYSRDFGRRTAAIAKATSRFDPSPLWEEEKVGPAHAAHSERMAKLAGDLACTVCHREARVADAGLALAPSWSDIATRYHGKLAAEEKLTHVVIEGADPQDRHWKDRADFTQMGANAPRISPDEARALVRWILSAS